MSILGIKICSEVCSRMLAILQFNPIGPWTNFQDELKVYYSIYLSLKENTPCFDKFYEILLDSLFSILLK